MHESARTRFLSRHDDYVEALHARVFPIFRALEQEAETFGGERYWELMSLPLGENVDPSSIADMVRDAQIDKFDTLIFLEHELTLGSLAGLYHIWERSFREFLEHESRLWLGHKGAYHWAWESNLRDLKSVLTEAGWPLEKQDFYPQLDACRLIVNVYKHGKGTSISQLARRYPDYLFDYSRDEGPASLGVGILEHEDILVNPEEVLRFASAMRSFWSTFPEHLSFANSIFLVKE